MTTTSTNNCSRQEASHVSNQHPAAANGSATYGTDPGKSRLPPRTRPIVALPPNRLDTVLDTGSVASSYEVSCKESTEDAPLMCPPARSTQNASNRRKHERKRFDDDNDDDYSASHHNRGEPSASQAHDMPGNRPPMWRQRSQEPSNRADYDSYPNKYEDERQFGSCRNRKEQSDVDLLPSKPSFRHARYDSTGGGGRNGRYHSYQDNATGYNHHPNSVDSNSTGSYRQYGTRYTVSTDSTGCDDTQCSRYPDASGMHPDDPFYPPGGSFQPYQAKYEPGYYRSSNGSCRHPPSPPVRDEPHRRRHNSFQNETGRRRFCNEKHPGPPINRSSSLQSVSQCEDEGPGASRRRQTRSASSSRRRHSRDRCSVASSDYADTRSADNRSNKSRSACYEDAPRLPCESNRGRSAARTHDDAENVDPGSGGKENSSADVERSRSQPRDHRPRLAEINHNLPQGPDQGGRRQVRSHNNGSSSLDWTSNDPQVCFPATPENGCLLSAVATVSVGLYSFWFNPVVLYIFYIPNPFIAQDY